MVKPILDLVAAIYAAAIEPNRASETFRDVAEYLDLGIVALISTRDQHADARCLAAYGISVEEHNSIDREYRMTQDVADTFGDTLHAGLLCFSDEIWPGRSIREKPYYEAFFKVLSLGGWRLAVSGKLHRAPGISGAGAQFRQWSVQ